MTGKIVKGIAGFYYVDVAGSGIYECKAKGIFRLENISPLVGDMVEIEITDEKDREASIREILPRKNQLYRPAVANVDQALIFFALANPKPNLLVLDRFLIQMEKQELPVILCFNKKDLADDGHTVERFLSENFTVYRHIAPAENLHSVLFSDDAEHPAGNHLGNLGALKKEHADAVLPFVRQFNFFIMSCLLKKAVRDLQKDPDTVADLAAGILAGPVAQMLYNFQSIVDCFMGAMTVDIDNRADPARIAVSCFTHSHSHTSPVVFSPLKAAMPGS